MIPFVFLLIGVAMGLNFPGYIPGVYLKYVGIAIAAGLDTIFGGVVAAMENRFRQSIFISGFFTNALLAAGMTLIGKTLDIDLQLAAIIVFGTRIFSNLGTIRHILLAKPKNEGEPNNLEDIEISPE